MFELVDLAALSAVTLIVVALVGTVGDIAVLRRCAAVVPAGPRRSTQGAAA